MGRAIAPEVVIALLVAAWFGLRWLWRRRVERQRADVRWHVLPHTRPDGVTEMWTVRSGDEQVLVGSLPPDHDEAQYEEMLAFAERRCLENNAVLRRELKR